MRDSTRHRRQPNKIELARFQVLADMGYSPQAIGRETGRDPKTVRKWLSSGVTERDDDLKTLVEQIKATELDDLYLLGQKARRRLHQLVETEDKMIPLIALQDRCFQQRRLLEGNSTAHIGILTKLIIQANDELFRVSDKPASQPSTGHQ